MKFRVKNLVGCEIAVFDNLQDLTEYLHLTAEEGDTIEIIGDDE